jgi:hypothetical protein
MRKPKGVAPTQHTSSSQFCFRNRLVEPADRLLSPQLSTRGDQLVIFRVTSAGGARLPPAP